MPGPVAATTPPPADGQIQGPKIPNPSTGGGGAVAMPKPAVGVGGRVGHGPTPGPTAPASVAGAAGQGPAPQGTATHGFDVLGRAVDAGRKAIAGTPLGQGIDRFTQNAGQAVSQAASAPPLSVMAAGTPFEPMQPMFQGAQWLAQDPARFASVMGAAAPGVTRGLLGTPFGLPAMMGLQGLMSGGQAFQDAHTLAAPFLKRIGLGGGG